MNKALMILINDGLVKVPHLLQSTVEDGKQVPWVQPHEPPVGDIHSGFWEIAKDGCSASPTVATGPRINTSPARRIKLRRNPVRPGVWSESQ